MLKLSIFILVMLFLYFWVFCLFLENIYKRLLALKDISLGRIRRKTKMTKLLTKSKYLQGLQCSKLLWVSVNDKTRFPEVGLAQQQIFDTGTEAGELATTVFKDGIKVPEISFMDNINKTKELLKENKPLFEAGFMIDDLFSRADVLVPVGDEWDIVEVKSSTKVKDVNVHDVSFQKFVYEKSGLKIRKCFLMFINKEYIRNGDIDVSELFVKEDITSQVEEFSEGLIERIDKMKKIINSDEPSIKIGPHCSDPYECALKEECWKFLPKNNVFNLSRGGKKSWSLFESGIIKIEDIPLDFKLSAKQEIQRKEEIFIDNKSIKNFILELQYPIYYLDFETINPCVPMFDGMKPYQRLPFQYSLHIQKEVGDPLEHISFLAQPGDCRSDILKSMKENLGSVGTILAWYQSFEIGVIKELIAFDESYSDWGCSIIERFNDLIIPFSKFYYYNPVQQGSASLKKVLPALTNLSYSEMEIGNGGDASSSFMKLFGSVSDEEANKIRTALEKYCELDTFAEVKILEELMKIVKND